MDAVSGVAKVVAPPPKARSDGATTLELEAMAMVAVGLICVEEEKGSPASCTTDPIALTLSTSRSYCPSVAEFQRSEGEADQLPPSEKIDKFSSMG